MCVSFSFAITCNDVNNQLKNEPFDYGEVECEENTGKVSLL